MSAPIEKSLSGWRLAGKVKWRTLVLVCGKCDGRVGRDGVFSKEARKYLKRGLHDLKPAVRVSVCGCLGICPKKALVVAGLSPGSEPAVAVVKSTAGLDGFCMHLRDRLTNE